MAQELQRQVDELRRGITRAKPAATIVTEQEDTDMARVLTQEQRERKAEGQRRRRAEKKQQAAKAAAPKKAAAAPKKPAAKKPAAAPAANGAKVRAGKKGQVLFTRKGIPVAHAALKAAIAGGYFKHEPLVAAERALERIAGHVASGNAVAVRGDELPVVLQALQAVPADSKDAAQVAREIARVRERM